MTSSPTSTSPSTEPATARASGSIPALGRLLCADPSTPDNIYELGKGGALFRVLSMAAIPTSRAVVADVTLAPSSNPNDDPANHELPDRLLWIITPSRTKTTGFCTRCIWSPCLRRRRSAPARRAPTNHRCRASASPLGVRRSFECKIDSGSYSEMQLAQHHRAAGRRLAHLLRACHRCGRQHRPDAGQPRLHGPHRRGQGLGLDPDGHRGAGRQGQPLSSVRVPAGDRLPERRLHGLRRPHRGRLHASQAPTPPSARRRGSP